MGGVQSAGPLMWDSDGHHGGCLRGETSQIQNEASCLIFVKLEVGTKTKKENEAYLEHLRVQFCVIFLTYTRTGSGLALWTGSLDLLSGLALWTCSLDSLSGLALWTGSLELLS